MSKFDSTVDGGELADLLGVGEIRQGSCPDGVYSHVEFLVLKTQQALTNLFSGQG